MTRALIAIAALTIVLALPAAAGSASSSKKTLVTTSVTGGFAGLDTTAVIRKDGSGTLTERGSKPKPLRVPAKEMARLRKRLEAADFPSLRNYPVPPGSADFIETRIRYGGKTVDASYRPPKRLRHALEAVDAAVNAGLAAAR
jgi:hypothetical protein